MNDDWREGLTDEELFEKWQGLIVHVIDTRDFGVPKRSWEHYSDDIYQEGCIGLWNAIKTYNSSVKCGWKHYACICIERKIRNWIKTYLFKFDGLNPDKAISYDDKQPGVTNYNSSENSDILSVANLCKADEHLYLDDFIKSLTPRQKVIVEMSLRGCSRSEIMDATFVSHNMIFLEKQEIRKKFKKYVYSW